MTYVSYRRSGIVPPLSTSLQGARGGAGLSKLGLENTDVRLFDRDPDPDPDFAVAFFGDEFHTRAEGKSAPGEEIEDGQGHARREGRQTKS